MKRTISICVVGVLAFLCCCSLTSALSTPSIPASSTETSQASSSIEPKAEPKAEPTPSAEPKAEPTPEPTSKLADSTTTSTSSSSSAASTTTTNGQTTTTTKSSLVTIKVTNGTVEASKNGTKTEEECGFWCKLFN